MFFWKKKPLKMSVPEKTSKEVLTAGLARTKTDRKAIEVTEKRRQNLLQSIQYAIDAGRYNTMFSWQKGYPTNYFDESDQEYLESLGYKVTKSEKEMDQASGGSYQNQVWVTTSTIKVTYVQYDISWE